MNRRERLLFHQIHPVKLGTDVATAAVSAILLWHHRLAAALAIGFIPSIVVSVVLVRSVDLERYRRSAFGQYVARFMTRRVEVARLAGLIPLWGGAWLRSSTFVVLGAVWIVGCWFLGFAPRERRQPN